MSEINPSSALLWYPAVSKLGIPIPKTTIIPVNADEILESLNNQQPLPVRLFQKIKNSIEKYPVFIRTDLLSGKHQWKDTCYVPDESVLETHVLRICASNENKSGSSFFHGVMNYSALLIREFLQLETSFLAFAGEMPISKERRYFIKDGAVICHHPYWPESIFNKNSSRTAYDNDWQNKLQLLSKEDSQEITVLSQYATKVSRALPQYWSVDFAKGVNGVWYLIDMARGENSYHFPHNA